MGATTRLRVGAKTARKPWPGQTAKSPGARLSPLRPASATTGLTLALSGVRAFGSTAPASVVTRSFLSPQTICHHTAVATPPYGPRAVAGIAGKFGWPQVMTAGGIQ